MPSGRRRAAFRRRSGRRASWPGQPERQQAWCFEKARPKDLEAARKEAERRVTEKIPPGYKDRDKDDPTGDYIVWRQRMDEAKIQKLPVVFITDDSRSDDWYRREHGMTLGARHELREEMYRAAGVPLLMMTSRTFLLHAKTYLNAKVSKETVEQARELAERRAKFDGMRRRLIQELGKLQEAHRSADEAAASAAMDLGLFEYRSRETLRDAATLDPAVLTEAEAGVRLAHAAHSAAEARRRMLAVDVERTAMVLRLFDLESEGQGDQRASLDQMYRDVLARSQVGAEGQRAPGR